MANRPQGDPRLPNAGWVGWVSDNRPFLVNGAALHETADGVITYGPIVGTGIAVIGDELTLSRGYVALYDKERDDWYIPRGKEGRGELKFKLKSITGFEDKLTTFRTVTFNVGRDRIALLRVGHKDLFTQMPPVR